MERHTSQFHVIYMEMLIVKNEIKSQFSVFQAYVNMALFENFTYAGIDATAEEA